MQMITYVESQFLSKEETILRNKEILKNGSILIYIFAVDLCLGLHIVAVKTQFRILIYAPQRLLWFPSRPSLRKVLRKWLILHGFLESIIVLMIGLSSSGHCLCRGMFLPKPLFTTYNFHSTIEPAIALYEDIMRVCRKDLIPMLMYSNLEAVLRPRVILTQKMRALRRGICPPGALFFGP
ncbi:hypothetical protein CFP56_025867 [Quercus suber]|uniref:Uncharacterized protein n=1 Tax=Quercus suber TaxID=58331 RepID=A0AAW0K2K7_QUESU